VLCYIHLPDTIGTGSYSRGGPSVGATTDTACRASPATASSSRGDGSWTGQATTTVPKTGTIFEGSAASSSSVLYVAEEEWVGTCTTDQLQSGHQQHNIITSGVDPLVGGQPLSGTATIGIPQNITFESSVLSLDEDFDYGFDTTFTPISGELDPLTDEFVPRKMTPYNG
jgi:hypothetical protein